MEDGPASAAGSGAYPSAVPWNQIPKFIPGETDVRTYARKLEFLQQLWPKEHLEHLGPRAALAVEGMAFQKVSLLDASKLRESDGVAYLMKALGGPWRRLDAEEKYDLFEKALYMTATWPGIMQPSKTSWDGRWILLRSGPMWHKAFRKILEGLGFLVCPLDGCLFSPVTPEKHGKPVVRGVLGIHVNDGIGGGDENFHSVFNQLKQVYDFGVYNEGEFEFCGVRYRQWDDGTIEMDVHQEDRTH